MSGASSLLLRRPLLAALAALPLLLAWDASGWDLLLSRMLASPAGFPLRDHALLVQVLHRGGRVAAAVALAAQAVHALLPVLPTRSAAPVRAQRLLWLAMTLLGWMGVSWLKSKSSSSCPWDLAAFGGAADYVGHWSAWWRGIADGGPGRCFPSGHAVAGFAFFSLAFLWRRHRPQLAARFAAAAFVSGSVLGATQVLRGAHFVSHVMWAAWCCWLLCAVVAASADSCFSARTPAAA